MAYWTIANDHASVAPVNGFEVQVDLTPWVRNPNSGIGKTARFTLDALAQKKDLPFSVRGVAREGAYPRPKMIGRALLHTFEHKLPRTLGITRILTVHDLWTLKPNPFQSHAYQKRQRPILERALRLADAIITPSESVKNELLAWFGCTRKPIVAVPHGYQMALQGPPSAPNGPLSPQVGSLSTPVGQFLSLNHSYLLTIGCIETRKNLTTLLEALNGLKGLSVRLAVVGRLGFGGEAILERLESHPRRAAIGYFPEVSEGELRALMIGCAAYVQPSLAEGFGMPVLDALQFGKRLVLSELPVFREIADRHATYFDPASPEALTEAIATSLSDETFDAAASTVRSLNFTWPKAAASLCDVYSQFAFTPIRTPAFFLGSAKTRMTQKLN